MKRKYVNEVNDVTDKMIKSDFSAIKMKMENNEGTILKMNSKEKNKKNIFKYSMMSGLAVAGVAAVFVVLGAQNNVVTTVTLDVNPGVEFGLNSSGEVVDITATNSDATKIVENVDVVGDTASTAANEILGEMINNNYITESQNSVLVSTSGENAETIRNDLTSDVETYLTEQNIKPNVIGQTTNVTNELENNAEKYNLSTGKLELINKIIEGNSKFTVEELSKLSISELYKVLSGNYNFDLDDLDIEFDVNAEIMVSDIAVKDLVFTDANVSEDMILDYEAEFDVENYELFIEIDFETATNKYEYIINATSGEIVSKEVDVIDNDDDNDIDDNDDNDNDNNDDDNDDDDNDDDDDDDDNDNDDDDDDNDND